MPVISLKNRITENPKEFERYKKSNTSLIYTDAKLFEDFSIELTLGNLCATTLSRDRAIMYAVEDDEISINPKSSVIIEVAQHLRIPNNVYGLLMPKGQTLLEYGILIASTKIETAFDGKLRLLLFNVSTKKRTIKKNFVIASAVFFSTDKTLEADSMKSREPVISKSKTLKEKLVIFVKEDTRYFISLVVTVITSSLTAAIITYFLLKK